MGKRYLKLIQYSNNKEVKTIIKPNSIMGLNSILYLSEKWKSKDLFSNRVIVSVEISGLE